jgi:hypothetical protein
MSSVSSEYHNLRYAILTLCDCIESCEIKKVVEEKYIPKLDILHAKLKQVKKELAKEMSDQKKQRERWAKEIKGLIATARLDETLSDNLKERIVTELNSLAEMVKSHEDT